MIKSSKQGYIVLQTLIFAGISVLVISALVSFAKTSMDLGRKGIWREQAFQIAEAGIEYYRWHLAHAKNDYRDGTGVPGPYVHNFSDKDGNVIGTFTLNITPPLVGSTLVTVESEGKTLANPTIKRKLRAKLAIPSFAKFAQVSSEDTRFGEGTEVFGPIHSNGGIRFDGLAHNLISSSLSNYNDPDHNGNNEFSVHTHLNAPPATGINDTFRPLEAPPTTPVPQRTDVFLAGRSFPVPAVDFEGMTLDLSNIKAQAQASGRYFANSGAQGYRVVLRTNDTFDLYRVNSLTNPPNGCTNVGNQTGWGTWSVNGTTLLGNYAFPANGLVFFEDRIWVEGQVNTARLTIASARFPDNPATRTSITINNNLLYTNYDGQDVVSLIAQQDINVGMVSQNNLRIDAALVAQNGRAGRYFYEDDCSPYDNRSTLTLYGMIATDLRYGFAYTDGSGYNTRNIIYDSNLLYGPPPSFPLTSDQYQIISWEEVIN